MTIGPSQDSHVISAAMLGFFEETDWNSDWAKGDYAVVRPQWSRDERPNFDELLNTAIERSNAWASEESDKLVGRLTAIKESVATTGELYRPGTLVEPPELELDDRIVVSDVEWSTFFTDENTDVKNRTGRMGSIRVAGHVSPPCYSRDGNYAIVTVDAPWSMHSAVVHFFLQKTNAGWEVFCVDPIFFF